VGGFDGVACFACGGVMSLVAVSEFNSESRFNRGGGSC